MKALMRLQLLFWILYFGHLNLFRISIFMFHDFEFIVGYLWNALLDAARK
jgi:hypothetical protein